MTKLVDIKIDMEKALSKYPVKDEPRTKLDPLFINSILNSFKKLTRQAGKISRKYLEGQDVLTIDAEFYDTPQEYHQYLLDNEDSIREGLEQILEKVSELTK